MKSKRRLGICLAVGILVLAVSAAAAFGSVNGYARYKQAVKDLLLREDNFTVQAQTHLSVDGERLLSVQMDYAKAGLNSAYHSREDHGGESHQGTAPCSTEYVPGLPGTVPFTPASP